MKFYKLIYSESGDEQYELYDNLSDAYRDFNSSVDTIQEGNEEYDEYVELYETTDDDKWKLIDSFPEPDDDVYREITEVAENLQGIETKEGPEDKKELIEEAIGKLEEIMDGLEEDEPEEDDTDEE